MHNSKERRKIAKIKGKLRLIGKENFLVAVVFEMFSKYAVQCTYNKSPYFHSPELIVKFGTQRPANLVLYAPNPMGLKIRNKL